MMKRRLLALLLALTMTAALTACGSKEPPEANNDSSVEEHLPEQENAEDQETADQEEGGEEQTPEAPQADEEPVQPEEAQPEAEKPAQKPADPKPQQKPAQKPQAPTQKPQAPAQKPAEEPAAKPENKPASVDLAAFVASLTKSDAWPALMKAEGEVLDSYYPGLSEIAANQCEVHTSMISAAVGEIALVEVQNAADVQKVKDIFQARVNYQVGDETNPGGAWYPEAIEGWKNGSRIVSNGNYVMLVALNEGADSTVASFNALFA